LSPVREIALSLGHRDVTKGEERDGPTKPFQLHVGLVMARQSVTVCENLAGVEEEIKLKQKCWS
jgi:hypothetical protein